MNNYQLYRTNVKLGGQVAWNLVLEDYQKGLTVSYFDVTPISPNVEYNYGQNTDCLQYTHQENVRELYTETQGQFYEACIDPRLETLYPILDDNDIVTHDSSLDMGCSRISFKRYGKQLQAFCPVWLEDFKSDDILSFEIQLYTKTDNSETVLATKRLNLKSNDNNSYHDKFVQYFKNYVDSLSEEETIGDDVLNVDVTGKFASMTGLDIKSGDIVSKDISQIVPNLFERERPLMETDYILIDNFHTGEMIVKQLFNFNLVFDISDIVSNVMDNMLKDNKFFIKVNVYKNGVQLEKRSFNNNYSPIYLSKEFEYLHDDRCIDFIRYNKLAPDVCHFTLNDNPNYIFNLYPGFATVYPMFYKDSPNYWEYDAFSYPNVLTWINCKDFSSRTIDSVFNDIVSNPEFTKFSVEDSFVKDNRIDRSKFTDEEKILEDEHLISYVIQNNNSSIPSILASLRTQNIDRYIFITPDKTEDYKYYVSDYIYSYISQDYEPVSSYPNLKEFVLLSYTQVKNYYILVSNSDNRNLLSYKWMSRAFELLDRTKISETGSHVFDTIKLLLRNIVSPKVIYLYNMLGIKKADSPWSNSEEIYYVKENNKSTNVIRYDGKIKPEFSKYEDLVWYRIQKMTAEEYTNNDSFKKENTQGYLPYYPSTGYFNIEYVNDDNYEKINEYKWFENSLIFNLNPTINRKIRSKTLDHYYSNEELIEKTITETYPNLTTEYKDYIISLYKADISYEYDEPAWEDDHFNYIYSIKLELQ